MIFGFLVFGCFFLLFLSFILDLSHSDFFLVGFRRSSS